jgi:hypothetical protein
MREKSEIDNPNDVMRESNSAQSESGTSRAIAGVFEEGFCKGWGQTVPAYPSYRPFRSGSAVCVLKHPANGEARLQVHLFVHSEGRAPPQLGCSDGVSSWEWELAAGWQTVYHDLPAGEGDVMLRFVAREQVDEPWWEFRVNEISLLNSADPRLRG